MNKTFHIGNLTKDPESKVMTNGETRTTFTVAVNRNYVGADGVRGADFINYVAYRKTAENVARYLTKGRKVAVEGHVRTGSYEKDGRTIWTTEFIADTVEFLSGGQESAPAPQQEQEAPTQPPAGSGDFTEVEDPELPF